MSPSRPVTRPAPGPVASTLARSRSSMAGLASIPSTSSPVAGQRQRQPAGADAELEDRPRPGQLGEARPRWPRPGTRRRTSRRRRRRRPRRSCPTRSPAPAQSNTRRAWQRPGSGTGRVAWVHGRRRHRLPRPRGDRRRCGPRRSRPCSRSSPSASATRRGRTRPRARRARRSTRRATWWPTASAAGPARSCSPAAAPRPTTSPSSASCAAHGGVAVCAAVEHHAVLHPVEHLGGRIVGVDGAGVVDLDAARRRARRRRSPSCR